MLFRVDFRVIWCVEFEYGIRFLEIVNFFSRSDFMQNIGVAKTQLLTSGSPPAPNKWLTPLNQYIFRKYIPWLYLSLLNFSEIFYSKKVFFVLPEGCKIVKMLNFDPHLAPPTFRGAIEKPNF